VAPAEFCFRFLPICEVDGLKQQALKLLEIDIEAREGLSSVRDEKLHSRGRLSSG
jgi:hypothetical protein